MKSLLLTRCVRRLYLNLLSCQGERLIKVQNAKIIALVFLDPEGGSQNAAVVVLLLGISSLKIPKAFLIRSGAQQNFAYTFVLTFATDLPSQIF